VALCAVRAQAPAGNLIDLLGVDENLLRPEIGTFRPTGE
jgi:hypothetical protein